MKVKLLLLLLTITLCLVTSFVYAGRVRGKLDRYGPRGITPAPFVPVTLLSRDTDQRLEPVYTGSDGMYCFENVEAGNYILEIWSQGFDNQSFNYEINVLDQTYTDIRPILITSLIFEFPEEGDTLSAGTVIESRGTHTLSSDVYVWIVLSDSFGNYYLQNPPIHLREDGSWIGRNIHLGSGIIQIHTVLVTDEGDEEFRRKVSNNEWGSFNQLPNGSHILVSRNIIIQ